MLSAFYRRFSATEADVRRILIGSLAIGFASLIAVAIAIMIIADRTSEHSRRVAHTYEVESAIAALRLPMWQAEAARRGYVISANPAARRVYIEATSELKPALNRIVELTMDNPRQAQRLVTLRGVTEQVMAMRAASVAIADTGKRSVRDQIRWVDEGVPLMVQFRSVAEQLKAEEQRLLAIRNADQAASERSFFLVLLIAGVLLVIVAAITVATLLRYTSDLTGSRDTLRDLADTLEDAVRDRTADLTRANDEIQRFAYIVSHDLRSPLVNVLGFTAELEAATGTLAGFVDQVERDAPQLLTSEARIAAREDLPEAIGFIRGSTQKMDRLINAILKLARDGKRAIAPEPLDLDAMVGDIRASLQHRLDQQGAQVTVPEPLPPLTSDRIAIDQILSNLIENAVKYLQPGRAGVISVAGRQTASYVVLEVADNGRGIDPRDHQRVFDLFRRAGVQDQPGEGIGLAHVRALAYRLGGTIDVESVLGEGAIFRVSLPAKLAEARDA